MEKDQVLFVLLARQYLYNLFHLLLGQEPTEGLLDTVFSPSSGEAFALFLGESPEDARLTERFDDQAALYGANRQEYLDCLTSDYTRLFIGPLELAAPPWECVYLTGKRVLFQESTLIVREAYRKEGFLPSGYPRVSDDHISLELDFMSLIAKECQARFELDDLSECGRILAAQLMFLTEHLLKWVPSYAADLEGAAPQSLYGVVARLIASFIRFDEQMVEELMELVSTLH